MSETEQLAAQVAALTAQLQAVMQRQQFVEQRAAEEAAAASASNGPIGVDANIRAVLEQQTVMFTQMMHQQMKAMRENKASGKNLIDTRALGKAANVREPGRRDPQVDRKVHRFRLGNMADSQDDAGASRSEL